MSHVYCSECGFQNPEVANYCARCGSLLREEDGDETTQSYALEEEADLDAAREVEGPALVIRSGGGRSGEHFPLEQERTTIGRSPDCDIFLDDVTVSRRHAVALRQGETFVIEDQGSLNGTFLNRRRIESAELSDDDELQIGKYRLVYLRPMTTTVRPTGRARPARKLETIGAVCRKLSDEFPDISISKIRYLEDQGLLSPRRTPGGYRLFSEEDIERLQAILRLQRDEFLPLRVIRQELATRLSPSRRGRASADLGEHDAEVDLHELCERAHITRELARDLEEYGLLSSSVRGGEAFYTDADVEIALACGRLAASGMTARHLRTFRTTADRAAGLLDQVAAPALRSRNPERHQEGLAELRALGVAAQELTQLLLWRAVRKIAAG